MCKKRTTYLLALTAAPAMMLAQTYLPNTMTAASGITSPVAEGLSADIEVQASVSNNRTPLWLNANRYGISSLSASNGYLKGMAVYDKVYEEGKYELTAAADVLVPLGYKSYGHEGHHTDHLLLQQAFVEGRYKLGTLTIGAKQQPMELKNDELSSGSQTLGINARPVPQVRLALNDYWQIPVLNKWFAFKGHLAYGMMTDGAWQEDFSKGSKFRYNKNTRYHEKAGYLKIGKEETFPLTLTLGLEMASQFGGRVYNWMGNDETQSLSGDLELSSSFKSYINAFTGMSTGDVGEDIYKNSEGNHLGSWVMRLDWKDEAWEAGFYLDHFFEDHSAMFLLDKDGYGTGSEWNTMVTNRYFGYSLKDMMLGADVKLKNFRYINQAVVEYVNTRYQSGPIYHDRTQNISDHIGGQDEYYNHSSLPGWQHWGQVIGNPLYLSPLYNADGNIYVYGNRFKAWHFAFAGDPADGLHYRAKVSWQRGWGTYLHPYVHPMENTSIMAELTYAFPETSCLKNFKAGMAYGADFGELRGDNSAFQFTLNYSIR